MEQKGFGERLEAFFAGKGFYIVLFLCAAVIGVSAWAMLAGKETVVEPGVGTVDMTLAEVNEPEWEGVLPVSRTESEIFPENETLSEPLPETQLSNPTPEEVKEVSAPVEETVPAAKPQEPDTMPQFFIWPVSGEIENAYSMTALQYNRTMRDWRTHDGLDIAAALGEEVKAAATGTVSAVLDDDMYGTTVVISHGGGLVSSYSNLAAMPTVKEGDGVVAGQVIGAVGDTALCETGEVTHLHFSMALEGESVDPAAYMP